MTSYFMPHTPLESVFNYFDFTNLISAYNKRTQVIIPALYLMSHKGGLCG